MFNPGIESMGLHADQGDKKGCQIEACREACQQNGQVCHAGYRDASEGPHDACWGCADTIYRGALRYLHP